MMSSLSQRTIRFLARLAAAKDGVMELVEFALVLPMLVALIFGIYEFGLAVWTQGMLDYAVEQASRCASIASTTTCNSASAIKTYAAQQTAPLNLPTTVFSATTPTCGNLVSASYVFSFVGTMPIIQGTALFPTSITLTSSSCYPI
jgi:Flp pilus assembly protein TadG